MLYAGRRGAIQFRDRVGEHEPPARAGARQQRVGLGRTVDDDLPWVRLDDRDRELVLGLTHDLGAGSRHLCRVQEIDKAVGLV